MKREQKRELFINYLYNLKYAQTNSKRSGNLNWFSSICSGWKHVAKKGGAGGRRWRGLGGLFGRAFGRLTDCC